MATIPLCIVVPAEHLYQVAINYLGPSSMKSKHKTSEFQPVNIIRSREEYKIGRGYKITRPIEL